MAGPRPARCAASPAVAILALSLGSAAPLPASAGEADRAPPQRLAVVEGAPAAPALRLDALDGGPVALAAGDPPTIVHFFATWCAPCRTELPALAEFARLSGVPVLLVDVAEPADRIRQFFAGGPSAAGRVLLDQDRAAARAWGVSLLPASFVVISGRIALAREGEVDWADPETRAAIADQVAASTIKTQGEQTR